MQIRPKMAESRITLTELKAARQYLQSIPDCVKTPVVQDAQEALGLKALGCSLSLKLECMQNTGSFKLRGVLHQVQRVASSLDPGTSVVTFSGGNYGKAFATVTQRLQLPTVVVMPNTAPKERVSLLESLGATTDLQEICNLNHRVAHYAQQGMRVFHPYDDPDLVLAYGSVAFELLEQLQQPPDVILVPCGGGGLVSGIAAALRLSGCQQTRIFAVEPAGAPTMHQSMRAGYPVTVATAKSVATGLAPPNAGTLNFLLCKRYVDDVLLVEEEEIEKATSVLVKAGFLVEPSGAAAFAALWSGKVPGDLTGKHVCVVISGRNISSEAVGKYSDM